MKRMTCIFILLSETSYTSVLAILKFLLASDVLGSSLFEISKCWENEWNKHNWSSEKWHVLSRNEVIKEIFYE